MNKFNRFLRTVPMKIYIILVVVVLLSFFSNDFGLVDIQKTAVILAAGIDKEGDEYVLTAQIANPQGGGSEGVSNACITIQAQEATVSECVTRIYTETGWVPKLVFCNLVLVGEEAAKDNAMPCLDFFLRNEYMPDSCHVAVCKGTAKDFLYSESAMDDTPAQAIDKLFSEAAQKSGKVSVTSLREFAVGHYGVSKSGHMPYLVPCGGLTEENGGSGGSSGGSGGEEKPKCVYCAERTALFHDGKMVGLLEREETFAFNLIQGKVFSGTFVAEEKDALVSLSVLKNSGGVSLSTKGVPKVDVTVDMTIRLHNRGVPVPMNDVAEQGLSEELQTSATKVIEGHVQRLVDICKESGCDLFYLKRQLYRSSLKKYEEWKDVVPFGVETNIKTNIKSVD